MTQGDKIVIVMNNLSTKITNTITTNVTTTGLINCDSKKVRDCYILCIVLLITIIFLIAVSLSDKISSKTFITISQIINKFCINSINWKWVLKI